MRRVVLAIAIVAGACGAASEQPAPGAAGAAGEVAGGGTGYAPLRAPAPPARGVAPAPSPAKARIVGAGPVCGDPRVIGVEIGAIQGSVDGCGVGKPVRLSQISGVALSSPIRVNCATARTVANWLDASAKPAAQTDVSSQLVSIRPVASYACRSRNSRKGARLSEHARGNAVDIAAFTFADGTTATVLNGYKAEGPHGRFLRKVWKQACDHFGTVLGPRADRYHKDHFHVDIARHQNGSYCR